PRMRLAPLVSSLLALVTLAACVAPARPTPTGAPSAPGAVASGPKRVVVGVLGAHVTLNTKSIGPGRPPGYDALEALVSAGLANVNDRGLLHPQLAEDVPTIENGLWRVLPDGRMETTWHI